MVVEVDGARFEPQWSAPSVREGGGAGGLPGWGEGEDVAEQVVGENGQAVRRCGGHLRRIFFLTESIFLFFFFFYRRSNLVGALGTRNAALFPSLFSQQDDSVVMTEDLTERKNDFNINQTVRFFRPKICTLTYVRSRSNAWKLITGPWQIFCQIFTLLLHGNF